MTYTRKDYLDGKVSHSEYYGQFVIARTRSEVLINIGIDRIKKSTDEYLNDIPLTEWDACPVYIKEGAMKEAGDYLTKAVKVCILKEAARQLIN